MKSRNPKTDLAVRFLRSLANAPGTRLPPVGTLASHAGVSLVTMVKAVGLLRREGVLSVSHGRGIRVAAPAAGPAAARAEPEPAAAGLDKWQQLALRIQQEVITGAYARGSPLPPTKELVRRYAAAPRTIRKSLALAERNGFLERNRRGFRVPLLAGSKSRATVVLIGAADAGGRLAMFTNRLQGMLRDLERECGTSGLGLVVVPHVMTDQLHASARSLGSALDRATKHGAVIGYMVWTVGMWTARIREVIGELIPRDRPVALLDETGVDLESLVARERAMRVFRLAAGPAPGRSIGQHLMGLGHRSVAYLSVMHDTAWSSARLTGLTAAFEDAGYHDAVVPCTSEQHAELYGTRSRATDMLSRFNTRVLPMVKDADLRQVLRMVRDDISRVANGQAEWALRMPVLEQALAAESASAWVCADDGVAVQALEFLKDHGRRVPADISVVGFDDTILASEKGLTSFNFDCRGMVHTMLSYICGPAARLFRGRAGIEVPGYIAIRSTTASRTT